MALSSVLPFEDLKLLDDGVPTWTTEQQKRVEDLIETMFTKPKFTPDYQKFFTIDKKRHAKYLRRGLKKLGQGMQGLDASRPWIVFWILHSLDLLDVGIEDQERISAVSFLKNCQNSTGGFGGGPMQQSHLAPTYAAVNALAITGLEEAYEIIDRRAMYKWLKTLRNEEGAFMMHENGEVDVRGCYCAIAVAKLLKIDTPELFVGTPEWIGRCQSYEGGLSGYPNLEAHGGYTHCGVAALCLLDRKDVIDEDQLLWWMVHRQMKFEGGFQGRTNKLVDGCYTFWVGCCARLTDLAYIKGSDSVDDLMYDRVALQEYVLLLSQHIGGGFKDKPPMSPDYYHTCYVLSGLAASQHCSNNDKNTMIVGPLDNLLKPIEPRHNLSYEKYEKITEYFQFCDNIHDTHDMEED